VPLACAVLASDKRASAAFSDETFNDYEDGGDLLLVTTDTAGNVLQRRWLSRTRGMSETGSLTDYGSSMLVAWDDEHDGTNCKQDIIHIHGTRGGRRPRARRGGPAFHAHDRQRHLQEVDALLSKLR